MNVLVNHVAQIEITYLGFRYKAFHRFEQAKFAHGGSILGSSQFLLMPQLPLKQNLI